MCPMCLCVKKKQLLCLAVCLQIGGLFAQSIDFGTIKDDVQKKLKTKPFEISGGASLNAIYTEGSQPIPQPFTYVASANIVCVVKGYKLPFAFTYSNKKFAHTNPNFRFNRSAFNPRYKNWAGHFGDVSMAFSPYTLSGVPIKGAGIEYAGDKIKIEAVAGRIYKAVGEEDSTNRLPTFYRTGAGLKTSYQGKDIKGAVAIFYAKDRKNSIAIPRKYENAEVRPMENLAFSISGSLPIPKIKGLSLESEVSTSVLTPNLMKADERDTSKNPITWLLKKRNVSTKVYKALKTALNYTMGENGSLALAYERVDPNYRTLGGLFFTNDFENITINAHHQGKVNMSLTTGIQRDDIADRKRSSTGRMVIAGNMAFKASEKMDVTMNYSNFQSYTFIQTGFERINRLTVLDNLDTLNYTQLSQNAGLNMAYKLGQTETLTQALTSSINFMESAKERNNTVQQNNATRFINGLVNYNLNWIPQNLSIATGVNYAINDAATSRTLTIGPTLSVAKPFFDKLVNINAVLAYNQSRGTKQRTNITTMSIGASTVLKKVHNLNMNIVTQYRRSLNTKSDINATASMGYNYTFSQKKEEKK
jgi:hypothetical protein